MGNVKKLSEYKRRRLKELLALLILLAAAILLLLSGLVLNPFYIGHPESDYQLSAQYKKGMKYVEYKNMDLDFTGYYKLDGKNNVKYNCYVCMIDELKYFVFVPFKGEEGTEAEQSLESYSFLARVREDPELFDMVAKDYGLSAKEFMEVYGVSNLVLDEEGSNYQQVLIIWLILLSMLIAYSCYVCIQLIKNKENEGMTH